MQLELNPRFVERYQLILQKDPKSKVFAPLAEAYRKMGFLEEAKTLCQQGLQHHPHYSSGHLVLGKILLDQENLEEAVGQFKMTADLSPENISKVKGNYEIKYRDN